MKYNSKIGASVVYYGPKDIRIEQMKEIPMVNSGEVLLKVEACAVCGSDIKTYLNGNPRMKPPTILGHELCGIIVECGMDVEGYKEGQRVTMATSIGCGECVYCKKGKTNLCKGLRAMGFHFNGAMAPYMVVPEQAVKGKHLIYVGDLDAEIAALSEPLSCAINDLSRPPKDEIESVLIIGLGPLGILHAAAAREKGIKSICCAEFPGKRAEMAKQLGFTTVLEPNEVDSEYLDLTGGEGFDLVIITAPSNEVQGKAPMYARKGGYVSYFASLPLGSEMLSINSRIVHYNELILYGTSDSTVRHVQEAVKLLRANPEGFRPLVTHKLPSSGFYKGLHEIKMGNAVKVVLMPS